MANRAEGGITQKRDHRWRIDLATLLLLLALLLAIYFLVSFSRNNDKLVQENTILKEFIDNNLPLKAGDIVPPFAAIDIEGRETSISYQTSPKHIFFVFSSHCPACKQLFSTWEQIALKAKDSDYVVHAISLDTLEDTRKYLLGESLAESCLMPALPSFSRAFRIFSTPQTIIVVQGKVEWCHAGALSETDWEALRQALKRE
jgi:peroxiredoxin